MNESKKLWGGRFEGQIDPGFGEFNNSFRFDRRLFEVDVAASIAYCGALENAASIAAMILMGIGSNCLKRKADPENNLALLEWVSWPSVSPSPAQHWYAADTLAALTRNRRGKSGVSFSQSSWQFFRARVRLILPLGGNKGAFHFCNQ